MGEIIAKRKCDSTTVKTISKQINPFYFSLFTILCLKTHKDILNEMYIKKGCWISIEVMDIIKWE